MYEIRINVREVEDGFAQIKNAVNKMIAHVDDAQSSIASIGRSVRTSAYDKSETTMNDVCAQLHEVSSGFKALEKFVNELLPYIDRYGRCAYKGNCGGSANVSLDDVRSFINKCNELQHAMSDIGKALDEEYTYISQELSRGIDKLEHKITECEHTLSNLKQKIERANAQISRLKSDLKTEQNRLEDVQKKMDKCLEDADDAEDSALGVFIPPYHEEEIKHSDGTVEKRNNDAEIHAALGRQATYFREANEYREQAAAYMKDVESIESKINEISNKIGELEKIKAEMEDLGDKLVAHIQKMKEICEELCNASSELKSIAAELTNSLAQLQKVLEPAIDNLEKAYGYLKDYCVVQLRVTRR